MPDVGWIRGELRDLLEEYWLIRDCILGSRTIKKMGEKYLPMPNPTDKSPENLMRYHQYKERAVFYNVVYRTLNGMTGQVFLREPVAELPNDLDAMVEDADGNGVSLMQLAQQTVHTTLAYGRCGLLVDYPTVMQDADNNSQFATNNALLTKAEIESQNIHPTITLYFPWDIINWQTEVIGSKRLLTLVVIQERVLTPADDFAVTEVMQWRVLRLTPDGQHYVEIWQKDTNSPMEEKTIDEPKQIASSAPAKGLPVHGSVRKVDGHTVKSLVPLDGTGKPFQGIPFTFVGVEGNTTQPSKPPIYDLAELNIAHYRNSADYEESCYITGQPTVWVSGLTEEWAKNVLGGTINMGARGGLPLPTGAQAGILQANPNTLPKAAMEQKEEQMVAVGAKLVQNTRTLRTATEVIVETTSESSVLAMVAKNVGAAFEWCCSIACDFLNVAAKGSIRYELNQDYDLTSTSAADRAEAIKEWQSGAIAFPEMRTVLRKAGIATMDDDEAEKTIAEELAQNPQPQMVLPPGADPNAEGKTLGQGGDAGASGQPNTGQ
ncbi:MAG: DUF4055 domain-containing protein [Minisyncoccia bacterium]